MPSSPHFGNRSTNEKQKVKRASGASAEITE